MPQKKISLSKPLLFTLLFGIMSASNGSESAEQSTDSSTSSALAENEDNNLLYQIPNWIDALPTFLPQQSNEPSVPPALQTADRTWLDRNQLKIRDWADHTSHKIDNWFGKTDPEKPASATLRVIVDNSWNKHDGYEIKPRIRGKVKLPTLERKVSLVFGDDSLDNELDNNVAITNENLSNSNNKTLDRQRTRENNSAFALRW